MKAFILFLTSSVLASVTLAAQPAKPVKIVDQEITLATQPSKVPTQFFLPFIFDIGDVAASNDEPFVVPAGMRLVIEHVEAHTSVPACSFDLFVRVSTYASGFLQGMWTPVAPSYTGNSGFFRNHVSAPFKKYADPESPVNILLNRNDTSCKAIGSVVISGYLEANI